MNTEPWFVKKHQSSKGVLFVSYYYNERVRLCSLLSSWFGGSKCNGTAHGYLWQGAPCLHQLMVDGKRVGRGEISWQERKQKREEGPVRMPQQCPTNICLLKVPPTPNITHWGLSSQSRSPLRDKVAKPYPVDKQTTINDCFKRYCWTGWTVTRSELSSNVFKQWNLVLQQHLCETLPPLEPRFLPHTDGKTQVVWSTTHLPQLTSAVSLWIFC